MSLDLSSLENAVGQFKDALDTYYDETIQNSPKYKKYMRSAVIQSFEYTYELTFKMIKRYLGAVMSNPAETASMSFKDIIREAYKRDLVCSDVSVWDQYRENRGITSHTYDEEKAQDVFEAASVFLHDAQFVLSSLQDAKSVTSDKKDPESGNASLQSGLRDLADDLENANDADGPAKKSFKTSGG